MYLPGPLFTNRVTSSSMHLVSHEARSATRTGVSSFHRANRGVGIVYQHSKIRDAFMKICEVCADVDPTLLAVKRQHSVNVCSDAHQLMLHMSRAHAASHV